LQFKSKLIEPENRFPFSAAVSLITHTTRCTIGSSEGDENGIEVRLDSKGSEAVQPLLLRGLRLFYVLAFVSLASISDCTPGSRRCQSSSSFPSPSQILPPPRNPRNHSGHFTVCPFRFSSVKPVDVLSLDPWAWACEVRALIEINWFPVTLGNRPINSRRWRWGVL